MPSFRDWWAEFISTRVGVRPATRLRDDSIYRCHLEPFFGDVPIDRIGFRDAQRFVAELAATGLAPRTVRKAAGLLAQSLDIAAPYRTFVLVGAYAGLRNGELAALRAKRVHATTATIDVTETRTLSRDGTPTFGPPKSRAGHRTVPVPSFVMHELVTDMSTRGIEPDDLIWTSPNGNPLGDANFRRRVWKPATEAAGLGGLRIHDLRHTCVAMWSRSLASPRAAAKWAGHSNPALILGEVPTTPRSNSKRPATRTTPVTSPTRCGSRIRSRHRPCWSDSRPNAPSNCSNRGRCGTADRR